MADSQSQPGSISSSGREPLTERYRELFFGGPLVVGTIVLAVGFAFLVLSASLSTSPPSPYLQSFTDRLVLFGFSVGTCIVGIAVIRVGLRFGGW